MLPLRPVLALALSACTTVANDPGGDPTTGLDETVFKCKVESILVAQCSYSACHGIAQSALRVYSIGKLRATPPADATAALAPLSPAEEHANYVSAAGFAAFTDLPANNWLLRKPLPPNDGGYEHQGGAIYTGPSDPQYAALTQWLTGATSCR
ncbi:hypothetical protein BH11MYX1_BH11MYX1_52150 [soil metagenome]